MIGASAVIKQALRGTIRQLVQHHLHAVVLGAEFQRRAGVGCVDVHQGHVPVSSQVSQAGQGFLGMVLHSGKDRVGGIVPVDAAAMNAMNKVVSIICATWLPLMAF